MFNVFRFVEWEDFADHAMVHNPRGGTAVLPKMITQKAKVDNLMGVKREKVERIVALSPKLQKK